MITKDNFPKALESLGFTKYEKSWNKPYGKYDLTAKLNSKGGFDFVYPNDMDLDRETTQDDHQKESYVVFLCVAQLFDLGYQPKQFKLEGKNYAGTDKGFCDILISRVIENDGVVSKDDFMIIECKTEDLENDNTDEFRKHWDKTKKNGDQLFRYFNTYRKSEYLCLYSCDWFGDKLVNTYNLISLIDNEKYLKANKSLNLKGYDDLRNNQGSASEFFDVWKNTYKLDYVNSGLLEPGNEPFKIGAKKFSADDLKEIDSSSMQKKYNDFATILRQHNVSGRENAFDKLVNYFLAKIVDETDNKNELECIWKGATNDDYFQLQDRLQKNYRIGMERFFGDTVSYIGDEKIDQAFAFLNNRADVAKDLIKEYFHTLKYFNNNPFAFIDVHNEELFYQNASVLTEIVKLLQDIKLKTNDSNQNQFLGDLFEGYLDQGVKQSEGQFFTPMPIVKFLISSLPLEEIVKNGSETNMPKAIDYACGAGHFLTELASQIKPFVEKHLQVEPNKYFENIIGIEKEYRLSKVSQVSAFMYGLDGIKILYADALAQNAKTDLYVKENDFSILVANPPYSVKGFLETLSDEDKAKFEVYDDGINEAKNNAIETFFVERASQLLKHNGVGAIILPTSILDKGGIYTKCREIIIKNFEIVSIVEFGSGTFGKTNTHTIALFLKRRTCQPNYYQNCINRVNNWFDGVFDADGIYKEENVLERYCKHINVSLEDYKYLLTSNRSWQTILSKYDIFNNYVSEFSNNSIAKEIKKRIAKVEEKEIKGKFTEEQRAKDLMELNEKLYLHILNSTRNIEMDKLVYYMLAISNKQPVLIVKCPDDNKTSKKFLGYDWSESKGNEGIKYLNKSISDEDNDIEKNKGINSIITPLFNPNNYNDDTKINYLIKNNYNCIISETPQDLMEYVSYIDLVEMMNFKKIDFEKDLKTTKEIEVTSIFPVVRMDDVCLSISNGKDVTQFDEIGKYKVSRIESISKSVFNPDAIKWTNDEVDKKNFLQKGDILFSHINSLQHLGKCAVFNSDEKVIHGINLLRIIVNNKKCLSGYLVEAMRSKLFVMQIIRYAKKAVNQASISTTDLKDIKLPLPPLDIQAQIVSECEAIDADYNSNKDNIEKWKNEIEEIVNGVEGEKTTVKKVLPYAKDRIEFADINPDTYVTTDNLLQNCEGMIVYDKIPNIDKVVKYNVGDILVSNIRPYLKKIWFADIEGGCSPDVLVFTNADKSKYNSQYLYYLLKQDKFFDFIMEGVKGMKMPRGDKDQIQNFTLVVPSLPEQDEIVSKIEALENNISQARISMAQVNEKKKAVLDKYLK